MLNELEKIEKYARLFNVPIIEKPASEVLIESIKQCRPKRILEIGTAIGYSGSLMLLNSTATLLTIEKLAGAVQVAKENFKNLGLENRVEIINGDANDVIITLKNQGEKFDYIFLDGPKSKYYYQLPTLLEMLETNGTIFADDVLYKGWVLNNEYPAHKHRTIILSLRKFLETVKNDKSLSSELINVGDGVLIIKKL